MTRTDQTEEAIFEKSAHEVPPQKKKQKYVNLGL